jgi:TatA/E family protein of Tat protein translocase
MRGDGMGLLGILIIVFIALLVFAPGKFTDLAGSLGHVVRDFKRGVNGESDKDPRTPKHSDKN